MTESQSPRTWVSPKWHPDYGDPAVELEHLKEFSLLLLSVAPNVTVTLETPEPGLMDVNIQLNDGTTAEVHSVVNPNDGNKRLLAIFFPLRQFNEEELYAESTETAVKILTTLLSR